jgi:hypothetical protein
MKLNMSTTYKLSIVNEDMNVSLKAAGISSQQRMINNYIDSFYALEDFPLDVLEADDSLNDKYSNELTQESNYQKLSDNQMNLFIILKMIKTCSVMEGDRMMLNRDKTNEIILSHMLRNRRTFLHSYIKAQEYRNGQWLGEGKLRIFNMSSTCELQLYDDRVSYIKCGKLEDIFNCREAVHSKMKRLGLRGTNVKKKGCEMYFIFRREGYSTISSIPYDGNEEDVSSVPVELSDSEMSNVTGVFFSRPIIRFELGRKLSVCEFVRGKICPLISYYKSGSYEKETNNFWLNKNVDFNFCAAMINGLAEVNLTEARDMLKDDRDSVFRDYEKNKIKKTKKIDKTSRGRGRGRVNFVAKRFKFTKKDIKDSFSLSYQYEQFVKQDECIKLKKRFWIRCCLVSWLTRKLSGLDLLKIMDFKEEIALMIKESLSSGVDVFSSTLKGIEEIQFDTDKKVVYKEDISKEKFMVMMDGVRQTLVNEEELTPQNKWLLHMTEDMDKSYEDFREDQYPYTSNSVFMAFIDFFDDVDSGRAISDFLIDESFGVEGMLGILQEESFNFDFDQLMDLESFWAEPNSLERKYKTPFSIKNNPFELYFNEIGAEAVLKLFSGDYMSSDNCKNLGLCVGVRLKAQSKIKLDVSDVLKKR